MMIKEKEIQDGDMFKLGNHKLLCGDSSQKETIHRLMQNEKANLLITDPPYGVNFEEKNKTILNKKTYSKISNDNTSPDQLRSLLHHVFLNIKDVLRDDASYYVFSPQGGDMELMMMMMMKKAGMKARHQLIWEKERPVFSMFRLDYDYQHEPILYGWLRKHHFYRRDGKQKSSIQKIKQVPNKYHPTSKPPRLIAELMSNSTQRNDLVIDTFGGGGTTLLVAEKLSRRCNMVELDPHYIYTIIRRYENITKTDAERIT